ncbi:oxidoreductase, NAD-binding domain protein [Marvinbryantia formatexigens DSM 14469]|uniref:Oxidoreductase, NAD-binding domain protein n=2 Tax=Marvinbryantia TaxID=248744 RepID=C6LL54_9FIRM|nr:oxidoreductase, NAD-binding domain protein [Marvinbryantia formatexigens DSM 14469]SDG38867.1 Oxidoreductase family, C-terminal alpha/beta domain [Marvinbryantia formatexigens]
MVRASGTQQEREDTMNRTIKVALAGLGSRGKDTYARAAKAFPDKMQIVAIADVNPLKVKMVAEEYGIPENCCYASAEEMLAEPRLADVMFITTQDRQHVPQAVAALRKGYHLLLEKPISPELSECREIVKVAKECDRKVVVCHVLRYTPVFRKVKEILDSGVLGDIVDINASENVGWFHMAHSFVRGNWRNSEESSPMILQKCCHDMDLYLWLANKKCKSLSSFGSTYLFKEEKAPEGCAARCLDGCRVKEKCPYDAEAIYLDNEWIGARTGHAGWPLNVLTETPTPESVEQALKTGPYGRCVYHCDNNVPDHQVVNLNMTDGSTMSFSMCGFTADFARHAQFCGTRGEMKVTMGSWDAQDDVIEVSLYGTKLQTQTIWASELADDFSGHGGGDLVMVEEFLDILLGNREESPSITSLEASVESHYCALAAEQSRLQGGAVIDLDTIRGEA